MNGAGRLDVGCPIGIAPLTEIPTAAVVVSQPAIRASLSLSRRLQ